MWPWGHLALGYIAYATYTRYRYDEHPAGLPAVAMALATQAPDLLDKPLAYTWAVLPAGRSLGHSLLVALPGCLALLLLARRARPAGARVGVAFVAGYLTHLLGDSLYPLLAVEVRSLSFLAWPLFSLPEDEITSLAYYVDALLESTRSLEALPETFVFELLLFVLAAGLWVGHRMPPFPRLVRALRREEPSGDG
ncbi:MAG: metal-dependent hydrolase [Halobacteriales archaeon]